MLKSRYLTMLALLSLSAFADVSIEEKKNRIEYLEDLAKSTKSMNIEAYRRELSYEMQNLSHEQRAENEANLLAEQIKVQVQRAFEASLETKTHAEAKEEVKAAIEKDIQLLAPELQNEIWALSLEALDNAEKGISEVDADLSQIEKSMLKGVKERSAYLNEEGEDIPMIGMAKSTGVPYSESEGHSWDAERKRYGSKEEVIAALVSDRDSARWVTTSNITFKGDQVTHTEANVSVQLKAEFLGVEVSAGPSISFKRSFSTSAIIMAEGMGPVFLPDGNFDNVKRDKGGNVKMLNGKPEKRYLNFTCDAQLEFSSEYTGAGGFSVAGIGGGISVAKSYSNAVTMTSRRIAVPESVEGKTATIKLLNSLCHYDFLKGKVTNTLDVAGSLNLMMKNVLSGLRFSHPRTKCIQDNHCSKWFNTEVVALSRIRNVARCVENPKEKYRACEIRGLQGQNCPVFDSNGQKVSDGKSEFTCDSGLKCAKVQSEGWLKGWSVYQYAKGKCVPAK
jgi:hypothetical protein